ncbi:MAG: hypothetical protein IKP74_02685, partial [Clostridia bacterium]|nr:hypothetical protein [Clostridia bacterium]
GIRRAGFSFYYRKALKRKRKSRAERLAFSLTSLFVFCLERISFCTTRRFSWDAAGSIISVRSCSGAFL